MKLHNLPEDTLNAAIDYIGLLVRFVGAINLRTLLDAAFSADHPARTFTRQIIVIPILMREIG